MFSHKSLKNYVCSTRILQFFVLFKIFTQKQINLLVGMRALEPETLAKCGLGTYQNKLHLKKVKYHVIKI